MGNRDARRVDVCGLVLLCHRNRRAARFRLTALEMRLDWDWRVGTIQCRSGDYETLGLVECWECRESIGHGSKKFMCSYVGEYGPSWLANVKS
jgi:hypothetical protein